MSFTDFWKRQYTIEKTAYGDLIKRQQDIHDMKKRGINVTAAIADLHKANKELLKTRHGKLSEKDLAFVRSMIADAMEIGMNAEKTITRIQANVPKLRRRWKAERAYWTEVKRDDSKAVLELSQDADIEEYKVILSPIACKKCLEKTNNGRKIFTHAELNKSGYGHAPPFHPNAVLGDTKVLTPNIKTIMRAHYSGDIFKITLAHGGSLTVTENHLVLTGRGFMPAHLLSEGDDVVNSTLLQRIRESDPDNYNRIPPIEEIFDTAYKTGSMTAASVPVSTEHLHGDGRFCDGDIDIISTDSALGKALEAGSTEHLYEFLFGGVGLPFGLVGFGDLNTVLVALALAADGIMSGTSIENTLGFSPALVHELEELLDGANYDTRLHKATMHGGTGDSQALRDAALALAAQVSFDNIVSIERSFHDGYVYDVSTASTLYTCNETITSNCYCITVPHV